MNQILMTGAAGRIGTFLRRGLPDLGWKVRGFDLYPTQDSVTEWVTGDVRDPAALEDALHGIDAVVHLAGIPDEAAFPDLLSVNIDGTYRLFEAARRANVERIVYASSNHAVGYHPRMALAPIDLRPRPDTLYGVTKVFGEALASLYADRYGMRMACLRIGTCFERPTTVRHLSTWLSPADAVRLVDAALRAPDLDFATVWGVSANTRGYFDLAPGRALGYQPRDDSEVYAAGVLTACGPLPDDDPDARYLGGRFIHHLPPE
jgi:uronate dehydrogenase